MDPDPGDENDPLSQNGYTYAGNNPIIHVDPEGECWGIIQKLLSFASKAGKVNRIAKSMKFGSTAFKYMKSSSRYVPRSILARAIVYGKKSYDGAKGYAKYTIDLFKNNKKYKLEAVYNKAKKTIRHFLYK
ncbi:MAG: repeat-associated core domain protein [Bacillales bacterium]|nr:repeat-associated core domain protein [Bacillales bacterium]